MQMRGARVAASFLAAVPGHHRGAPARAPAARLARRPPAIHAGSGASSRPSSSRVVALGFALFFGGRVDDIPRAPRHVGGPGGALIPGPCQTSRGRAGRSTRARPRKRRGEEARDRGARRLRRARGRRVRPLRRRRLPGVPARADAIRRRRRRRRGSGRARPRSRASGPPRARRRSTPSASSRRMPDGPLAPALRFAIASEMIASAAMGLVAVVPLALLAPAWVKHVVVDEGGTLARLVVAGVPGLAALLVAAHVAHGWALDRGRAPLGRSRRDDARASLRPLRGGVGPRHRAARRHRRRRQGGRCAPSLSIAGVGMGLPGRSARAFLRGCYRLEGAAAQPALRASYVAAAVATAVGAIAVIGALVASAPTVGGTRSRAARRAWHVGAARLCARPSATRRRGSTTTNRQRPAVLLHHEQPRRAVALRRPLDGLLDEHRAVGHVSRAVPRRARRRRSPTRSRRSAPRDPARAPAPPRAPCARGSPPGRATARAPARRRRRSVPPGERPPRVERPDRRPARRALATRASARRSRVRTRRRPRTTSSTACSPRRRGSRSRRWDPRGPSRTAPRGRGSRTCR